MVSLEVGGEPGRRAKGSDHEVAREVYADRLLLPCVGGAASRQNLQEQVSTPQPAGAGNQSQQVPEELLTNGTVQQVPPKPGEICAVCDRPLHSGDVVYLVDGQRVAVHAGDCDAALRARPQKSLARLRPKGGAFLGADAHPVLTGAWLYVGLYVLVGLVFAALTAQHALRAGYSPLSGLLLGLAFNIFGFLFIVTRPKREPTQRLPLPSGRHKIPATYEPQPCPRCGGENHPSATKCLGCGASLAPRIASDVQRAGLRA